MGTSCKGMSGRPNKTTYSKPDGWRKFPNPRLNRKQRRSK